MCGITGIFLKQKEGSNWLPYLSAANAMLQHRGPDAQKLFADEVMGMGHCRLSVIDLSEAAAQPMMDDSQRYHIVFNGEIFNHKSLRSQMESEGIRFQTHSDTEVILKLYMQRGSEMLQLLNGFFAFAIYDKAGKTCFIARDRFGEKPLFFYEDDHCLLFASEIKALLQFPIAANLDAAAIGDFLQLNYIAGPQTIYASIKKLMPGHFIRCSAVGTEQQTWYTIPFSNVSKPSRKDYTAKQDQLLQLMEEAVSLRLISDVPLGAFLSGGLDSSIICGLASKQTKHLLTFSVGFKEDSFFDETKAAVTVAKHFNTDHTAFILSRNDLYEAFFEALDHFDEPFGDSSALPYYLLSKLTRQKAKVALSGDGADEVFGGYVKHIGAYRSSHPGLSELTVSAMQPVFRRFNASRNNRFSNTVRRLQRFAEGMKLNEQDRYWRWCSIAGEQEAMALMSGHSAITGMAERKRQLTAAVSPQGDLNSILLNDLHLVLANDMLVKVDSMSMAHGLEVRCPFLDHRVVAFAFSLPEAYKTNRHHRKIIVQDAFRKLLPASLYHRPKHGFEIPLHAFLTTELRSVMEEKYLCPELIRSQGLFDLAEVEKLKQRLYSDNPGDSAARVWGLVVFQHWWLKWRQGAKQ